MSQARAERVSWSPPAPDGEESCYVSTECCTLLCGRIVPCEQSVLHRLLFGRRYRAVAFLWGGWMPLGYVGCRAGARRKVEQFSLGPEGTARRRGAC